MPQRIQRRRTKGWRKPPNSVIVDRTSKWGNPFWIQGDMIYCDASHRRKILSPWVIYDLGLNAQWPNKETMPIEKQVTNLYMEWVLHILPLRAYEGNGIVRPCLFTLDDILQELHDKDLVCWCGPKEYCHADILLMFAQMGTP